LAENVCTRLLARGTEIEGSTQGLAHKLRVPEATLLRWMEGKAQMPLKAYEVLLQFLQHADSRTPPSMTRLASPPPLPATNPERLTFPFGKLLGRCARCDGTEFRRYDANAPLTMTSVLECCSCFAQVLHGVLLAELGKDVVSKVRANANSRARRSGSARNRTSAKPSDKAKTAPVAKPAPGGA